MSTLASELEGVVAALRAGGVHASVDSRNVHGPFAWVTPHDIGAALGGNLTVRAAIYLVAPDVGGRAAVELLGKLLDDVSELVTFDEPVTYVTVTLPGSAPANLPALRIITSTE